MTEFGYGVMGIAVIISFIALLGYKWGYNEGKIEVLTNLMLATIEEEEKVNE